MGSSGGGSGGNRRNAAIAKFLGNLNEKKEALSAAIKTSPLTKGFEGAGSPGGVGSLVIYRQGAFIAAPGCSCFLLTALRAPSLLPHSSSPIAGFSCSMQTPNPTSTHFILPLYCTVLLSTVPYCSVLPCRLWPVTVAPQPYWVRGPCAAPCRNLWGQSNELQPTQGAAECSSRGSFYCAGLAWRAGRLDCGIHCCCCRKRQQ